MGSYVKKNRAFKEEILENEIKESSTKLGKIANCEMVNFREAANINANPITVINVNTMVSVLSESDGWTNVEYNGQNGFIMSEYVSLI